MSADLPLVFVVHPRTRQRLKDFGLLEEIRSRESLHLSDPMGYVEFMGLVQHARFVLTDSGGIQEETTYLNIPCLTLRDTTERPITIQQGTNRLVRADQLGAALKQILAGGWPESRCLELWDGRTASRIVTDLRVRLSNSEQEISGEVVS